MAAPKAAALPAQYAKFITALAGEAIAYVQLYGAVWHLEPALVMLGAALAVLGVPNAAAPVVPDPLYRVPTRRVEPPSGAVKIYSPADGPAEPVQPPPGPAGASA